MTAIAIVGGLAFGYLLGRCGWFVLLLIWED